MLLFAIIMQKMRKTKKHWHSNNIKMENNEFKKVFIENRTHYFDNIIKYEDFDFGNILPDEKSYENILIYEVLY